AMLTRLELSSFRSFHALTAEKLARVNLIVGKNNAGKTSLLQGAEILIRGGGLTALCISATGAPDQAWLGMLWNSLVLGPEEARVIDALRIIEPDLERLAFVPGSAGGFFVKLTGVAGRIPLGTMGEGMQRALSLALHLVRAEKSYLLVDEIDAGLHHSV